MKVFIGTVIANDRNGRVVELPDGAQTLRVTEVGGKNGGGVRIDYAVVLRQPETQPSIDEAAERVRNLSEDELQSLEEMVAQARAEEQARHEAAEAAVDEEPEADIEAAIRRARGEREEGAE